MILSAAFAPATWAETPAGVLGKNGDAIARAVAGVDTLAIVPANATGTRRWAAWSEGAGDGQETRLALFAWARHAATPLFTTAWPGAYAPLLRAVPEWRHQGQPLIALSMSFAAGAAEVDLFGLDAKGAPVLLAGKTGSSIGWAPTPGGAPLLVMNATASPACYAWDDAKTALAPQACPQ